MSPEVVLAGGYAIVLTGGAFALEWMSAHTHRRALRFRTAGFAYDEAHDHWLCPEGEQLCAREFDRERRLVRYRALAHVCNACPSKHSCTDSDDGREIVRPLSRCTNNATSYCVIGSIIVRRRPGARLLSQP